MIENSFITKRIEQAQKKVEENHFGIRKRLLEYDDVMNKQRTVVYEKRRHALIGERIGMDIANMIWDRSAGAAENCADYESLQMEVFRVLATELPFTEQEFDKMKPDDVSEHIFNAAMDNFKRKCERMAQIVTPVIKRVFESQGDRYENILIPITDGRRVYQIPCNLKEAYDSEGKSVVTSFQKAILLHTIDECWKENLRELDELKHSVQNASYEQKDPLLIFKLESVNLFDNMVNKMNDQTVSILMRGQIPEPDPDQVREAPAQNRQQRRQYNESRSGDLGDPNQRAAAGRDTRQQVREPIRVDKTPGRNDPCPCGSGKKFKNCHGQGL
jgi:preprotein translocase subunit SecA